MSSCRGIACAFAAMILIAGAIPPAAGSYFNGGYFPSAYEHSLYSSPALVNATLPGLTVTELARTDVIVAAPGDIINVSLAETDRHLNWEYMGGDGVQYIGNSLFETFPVRHVFKLKVNNSCVVRFKMIDDRDGKTAKTFELDFVVPPISGLGWPALSKDLVPSFGWPVLTKF